MKDFEDWQEGLKQLQEDVESHAHEEETKLFPQVKRIMDNTELDRMAKKWKNSNGLTNKTYQPIRQ